MEKVIRVLFPLENFRLFRNLRTRDRIVRSDTQSIRSLLGWCSEPSPESSQKMSPIDAAV